MWLEEKTSLKLEFNLIPDDYSISYLDKAFTSGNVKTDVLFSISDENIYYMPSFDFTPSGKTGQVFWLNLNWLKAVGMKIPQTTE